MRGKGDALLLDSFCGVKLLWYYIVEKV